MGHGFMQDPWNNTSHFEWKKKKKKELKKYQTHNQATISISELNQHD
jgi:hypothetical protein